MATAKFSDFTAVLGSDLASGDLLLVSRVGGGTSAKLTMTELRSYLGGYYSALGHTHGLSTLTGDTFTAGQLIAGTGAGGLLAKVSAGTSGSVLGWTTGGAITSITPSMPGHTHTTADITGLGSAATVSASTFAAASHTHTTADITGLGSAATVSASTFAAASHTHTTADITGLGSAATVAETTLATLSPSTLTRNLITPLNATSNAMRMVGATSQSAAVLHVGNGPSQTGNVANFVGILANTYIDSNGRACFDSWAAAQPFVMSSVAPTVTYLSADLLDGSHASAFATSSHTHGLSSLTGDTYTAGQYIGGTGAGGLLAKGNAGTVGQCLGWTTGGAFTAITPGTGSGGSTAARVMFSATALDSLGTNGASLLNLGDATTASLCRGFDDTTETYAYGSFQVPYNINTSGTVLFNVVGGMRSATSGSVGWTIGEREAAGGEAWTGAYTEYDSVATVVPGATTTQFSIGWSTTASALGWASGDTVRFRVSRDPSASGDASGDALLDYFYIDIPVS